MAKPDFTSTNLGSIIMLVPITDRASDWIADNIDPTACGESVNIEPRYFLDIAEGLLGDGLTLQDTATGRMARLPEEA